MNAFFCPQSTTYQKQTSFTLCKASTIPGRSVYQQHLLRTFNRTLSLLSSGPRWRSAPRISGKQHLVKAGSVSFQYEWEAYRAESDFHVRTLKLVREITHTIKQEWDLYNAVSCKTGLNNKVNAIQRAASRLSTCCSF